MRYFIKIAYNGSRFAGWQKQLNASTVQQTIEEAIAIVQKEEIPIMGCGRTDAGVHASDFYFHLDTEIEDQKHFRKKLNHILNDDISINEIYEVDKDAHVRFDAHSRSYSYYLSYSKDPFRNEFEWYYPYQSLDLDKLNEAAALLLNFKSFFPFCKSKTQVKTMDCKIFHSFWQESDNGRGLVYKVRADRFLRGMVRLIVGMCINTATDKLDLEVVKKALEDQKRIERSYSVPAHGLFLDNVQYEFLNAKVLPMNTKGISA